MRFIIGQASQLARLMLSCSSLDRAKLQALDGEVVLPLETHDPTKQYRISGNGTGYTAEDIPSE